MPPATIDSGAYRNPNRDLYVNLLGIVKRAESSESKDLELGYPRPDNWWTGKPPVHGICPGVDADGYITSLALPDVTATGTRQGLLDYFDNTWTLTEVLFSALQGESTFTREPWHQLRHPKIFYYGHVAVVYVNKLRVAGFLNEGLNEYLEQIMETGVDEMSWDDLSKNEMEWPKVSEVKAYRQEVYNLVKKIILEGDYSFPIKISDPAWAILMGFEHERIHLETSSVLMRELPLHLVHRPAQFPRTHPSAFNPDAVSRRVENSMVEVKGGTATLGKPLDFPSFGWDNEYGSREVEVSDFKASKFLITNGEFLNFVKAGGYTNSSYWTEAGWQWRAFRNVQFPTFWVPDGPVGLHQYKLRLIFEIVSMPMSWPADVNAHEAIAYCNWRTMIEKPAHPYRLITEAEHHLIRDESTFDMSRGVQRDFMLKYSGRECWDGSKGDNKYNTNLAFGSESPVDALPPSSKGLYDTFGNIWQWCEDDANPLNGFEVHPLYIDFSVPCFDGLHTMILGGSFISTGDESDIFSRFHFRPHFHQHAGFRMVQSPNKPATILPKQGTNGASNKSKGVDAQEKNMVDTCMLAHYGAQLDVLPWECGPSSAVGFPSKCAKTVNALATKLGLPLDRALNVGCSVGAVCFELALHFKEVVGVDAGQALIDAAQDMKNDGQRQYRRVDEGVVLTELIASVENTIDRTRVSFHADDMECLSADKYGVFDVVMLSEVLCKVANPAQCLRSAAGLVRPGGIVVISSQNDWSEAHTPKDYWLGGYIDDNGNTVSTFDGISALLSEDFSLVSRSDLPLLVRENARKYSFSVSEVSVWQTK